MTRTKTLRLAASAALCLLGVGAAQAQNLIVNGGFENPLVAGSYYEHRNGSELTGWSLFSTYRGTVQFGPGYDAVGGGNQAVQIEVGGDWISQSFATVVGQSYLLSFDLSAYDGWNRIGSLNVTVGPAFASFTGTAGGYVHETLSFAANSSTTTLRFENAYPTSAWYNYPHLDNVSVSAVAVPIPEPETYAMLLAGLSLLGFHARRRRLTQSA